MLVRELLTRLNFSVNDNKLKSYERSIGNIKTQADSAANAFRGMFAAFVGFQGLKSLANTADEMQSIEARIGMLPQTVGDVGVAFNDVADRASNAKQGISEYAGFFITAGNATQDFIKNQDDLLKIVDGAAMGIAAGGKTASQQSAAFFQLGQAIGSPIVQMEEMNTLIDVAPDLFRALGKAIPGANGNLKKFISTGTVTGKMLAEGLVKVMPQFEAQMKSMPITIGTASVLIKNRWSRMVANLNRESGAVTSIANVLLKGFDFLENGLNKIVDFFGGATQAVKFFGIALAAIALPLGFKMLVGFVAALLSPVGLLVAGLVLVGLAIEDVYQWATGGKSISGALFGDFKTKTKPVFDFIEKFKADFKSAFDEVSSFFIEVWGYIARTGQFFAKIIPFDAIFGGLQKIFEGVLSVFIGIINIIKGAFEILFGVLTGNFELAGKGIEDIFVGIGKIISGLGEALIGGMVVATATLWTMLVTLFTAVKNLIVDSIVGGIVKAIKAVVNTIWDNIVELFTSVKSFIFDSISGGVVSAIKKRFDALEAAPDFYFAKTNAVQPMLINTTPSTVANTYRGITNSSNYAPQQNITINQTLPAGSTVEVAAAAKTATKRAIYESPMDVMARQVGQAQ